MSILVPGDGARIALTTTGSRDDAERIVRTLVEEGLIACGNIIGPVTSIYRWKGKLCHDSEHVVVLKTQRDRVEAMADRIKALHGYECPEILTLPVESGHEPYLRWLVECTSPGRP